MATDGDEADGYRMAFERAPDAILLHDESGAIRDANAAATALLDQSGEQLRGRTLGDLFPVEDVESLRREAGTSGTVRTEWTVETADGARWITARLEADEGRHRVTYLRDATADNEAQTPMHERRDHLEAVVSELPVVLFALDASGTFTMSRGRGLGALGLEPGELNGVSVFDAYADHPDITDAVERALDGEPTRVEHTVEGMVFETRYTPVTDEAGEVTQVIGVAQDVTERKRREQALERSERQFEAVFNDPHLLAGVLDTDGTVQRINATALSIAGVEREDIEGTPFPETRWWSHDQELQADLREWIDRAADGEYVEFEAEHPHPDGGEMDVEGAIRPVTDDDGEVVSLVVSSQDITARKERKRQLEKSNERLEQFAYVASHDLQEPLRTISNYTEMLAADYGDQLDEEAQRFIDVVVTGSERMQSMINGLLDYSRVTTRGDEFEPVDVEAVVEDVAEDLDVMLDEETGRLRWESLPTVEADGDQLRQVLQNLVKNALEHSDEGPVHVEVRGSDEGDRYRFEVADDGPGIEPNRQEKIFRIFKSSQQYQTESQARGIGLAICDQIVDRHGGDIWVESDPGEGATFVFTIAKDDDHDQ